ncbi:MAG: hypothetical protein ACI9FR_000917 [Cryomorphaceae bacterium]|jgi:hypothetical protein
MEVAYCHLEIKVLVYSLAEGVVVDGGDEVIGGSVATLEITPTEKKFSSAKAVPGFANVVEGQRGQLLLSGG